MNARYTILLATPLLLWSQFGCFVSKCEDGGAATTTKDNCVELQMARTYEGTPVSLPATTASTGTVQIGDENGNIDVDRVNPAGTAISIEATPFDIEPANDQGKAKAIEVMNGMPRPTVTASADGPVTIESTQGGMHGWHLRVHLPSDFAGILVLRGANGQIATNGVPGPIEATATNGSISVKGVNNVIKLQSGNGGIDIAGLPRGAGSSAYTENGSITLDLQGTSPNLTISAVATDPITVEPPAGATWTTYGDVPTSQRVDIGDTAQGTIDLRTDFGDIAISG